MKQFKFTSTTMIEAINEKYAIEKFDEILHIFARQAQIKEIIKNTKTYTIFIKCTNCTSKQEQYKKHEIPLGKIAKKYLKNKRCPNCKCKKTLKQINLQP